MSCGVASRPGGRQGGCPPPRRPRVDPTSPTTFRKGPEYTLRFFSRFFLKENPISVYSLNLPLLVLSARRERERGEAWLRIAQSRALLPCRRPLTAVLPSSPIDKR